MQYFKRIAGIEGKNTLPNTDGSQGDSPMIPEQITKQTEEISMPLYKEEDLKRDVCSSICECFPNVKKLSINVVPSKNYIGNGKYTDRYYLTVAWENGASECVINSIVDCVLNEYFEYTHGEVPRSMIRTQLRRIFTDEVILKTSRKYADCIAPNLPLNMHNIHCFKVGGVPVYDLAKGELSLMDEVK